MSTAKSELDMIKEQQIEFQSLVQQCDRSELGQCAKLLAMYIAVYKQQFGDIPVESLLTMSETVTVDYELSQIIQNGIEEASSMLRMVLEEKQQVNGSFFYNASSAAIN